MGANGSKIPEKRTYKIGEVAALVEVEPYVLRYWETEFPSLQPPKSEHGQRVYRRQDVETVLAIKRLLYEQGFTIAGARKQLEGTTPTLAAEAAPEAAAAPAPVGTAAPPSVNGEATRTRLRAIRAELVALLTLLSRR